MSWRILNADVLSIAAGLLSIILYIFTPPVGILSAFTTATSVGTGGYALLWAGIRVYTHYTVTPDLGVGFAGSDGDLSLVITNTSPFPVLLNAAQFHYTPDILTIEFPDGELEEYDAVSVYAETFDPRLPYMQERREEVFRWRSTFLGANGGMTTLGLDLTKPPQSDSYIIPILYVRLYPKIRPTDIPLLPSLKLFNRLYEPIPLQSVTHRFEQEMPSFWDHQEPKPLDDPDVDWPDIYHRTEEDS